jgi:dCTP deaminase
VADAVSSYVPYA